MLQRLNPLLDRSSNALSSRSWRGLYLAACARSQAFTTPTRRVTPSSQLRSCWSCTRIGSASYLPLDNAPRSRKNVTVQPLPPPSSVCWPQRRIRLRRRPTSSSHGFRRPAARSRGRRAATRTLGRGSHASMRVCVLRGVRCACGWLRMALARTVVAVRTAHVSSMRAAAPSAPRAQLAPCMLGLAPRGCWQAQWNVRGV